MGSLGLPIVFGIRGWERGCPRQEIGGIGADATSEGKREPGMVTQLRES